MHFFNLNSTSDVKLGEMEQLSISLHLFVVCLYDNKRGQVLMALSGKLYKITPMVVLKI